MVFCIFYVYNVVIYLRLYEGILLFGLNIELILNVKKKLCLNKNIDIFLIIIKCIFVLNLYRIK